MFQLKNALVLASLIGSIASPVYSQQQIGAPVRVAVVGDSGTAMFQIPGTYYGEKFSIPNWRVHFGRESRKWGCNLEFVGQVGDFAFTEFPNWHTSYWGWQAGAFAPYAKNQANIDNADVLILQMGANDLAWYVSPEDTWRRLYTIIQAYKEVSKERNKALTVITTTIRKGKNYGWLEKNGPALSKIIREKLAKPKDNSDDVLKNVYYVDQEYFIDVDTEQMYDKVHPNSVGNTEMGQAYFDRLTAKDINVCTKTEKALQNLAAGRTIRSTGTVNGWGYPEPTLATDGNYLSNYLISDPQKNPNGQSLQRRDGDQIDTSVQELELDLGQDSIVKNIELSHGFPWVINLFNPGRFHILASGSTDSSWKIIGNFDNGSAVYGKGYTYHAVSSASPVRYIRIRYDQPSGLLISQYNRVHLREIKVFGYIN